MSFYQPEKLPKIMIAPNGARPKKKDHIEVPVTINEIVETAKSCFNEGAEGKQTPVLNNFSVIGKSFA